MNHHFFRALVKTAAFACIALATTLVSCTKPTPETPKDEFNISGVSIPANISTRQGEVLTFLGKGFKDGDIIIFTGIETIEMSASVPDATHFCITVPANLTSGPYKVSAKRGTVVKTLGTTNVTISIEIEIPDKPGTNVKGIVHAGGVGLEGVILSDGYEFTQTDKTGVYYLNSEKKHGYIFVILPSGYEAQLDGVIPKTFHYLNASLETTERVDFELTKAKDQTNHRVLIFGDMHLANRNQDRSQFSTFVGDVNKTVSSSTVPTYAITLGDMTWDLYWYDNAYEFANYLADVSKIEKLPIFHTIGNHDHEMGKSGAYPVGDFDTVVKYKRALGPTYYSFNIGQVHYIVLDDIYCTNNGTGSRTYREELALEQQDWVKKDLSYITDKNTPIVVTGHAPLWNPWDTANLTNTTTTVNLFNGFTNVDFYTGHSHIIANTDKGWIYDHNAGAVCATWWWTGALVKKHIAQDGSPGGYMIVDYTGRNHKWQFKGTGFDTSYQFRTYDRNQIELSAAKWCPNANDTNKATWENLATKWKDKSTANEVYINIFNWDPEWTIEVTENGKTLTATKEVCKDPLHLVTYSAQRYNKNATATFETTSSYHIFKVTASAANTTLEIKVKDQFGNVYTESMARPKAFTIDNY
ncbi:MAG: calcineurin-like phosphoesterase C-terminal domain-containing protein [Bacteroidales bacterium]|nr:calcineurin-like phosphoesterase C-terminal domain-containing protein [Bacteroidales bacterium]